MPRSFWGCQEFEKNQADSYRLESCESFFTTHWSLVLKTGLSREALRATTCRGSGFLKARCLSVWRRCSHGDTLGSWHSVRARASFVLCPYLASEVTCCPCCCIPLVGTVIGLLTFKRQEPKPFLPLHDTFLTGLFLLLPSLQVELL